MRILVTGAKGFVGKNLCWALKNIQAGKDRTRPALTIDAIYEYDVDTEALALGGSPAESSHPVLDRFCTDCDFVFNLAGVNRPQTQEEFMAGNFGFASTLLDTLKAHGNRCPVMLSSSQQASLTGRFGNSEYGRSKKAGEDLFLRYEQEFMLSADDADVADDADLRNQNQSAKSPGLAPRVLIYRFPNLFGKWCRPNYNSAVATFCNNIANDLPITVNDPSVELELLYIDDLVTEMLDALEGHEHRCEFNGLEVVPAPADNADGADNADNQRNPLHQRNLRDTKYRYCYCPVTHRVTLGEIVSLLHTFAKNTPSSTEEGRGEAPLIPEIPNGSFAKKLYSTYLSYLPESKVAIPLKMNVDDRGSFTELIHTLNCGQVSINISKPGITKGQHWHNTKWEYFIVVSGHGLIQQRNLNDPEGRILEFEVSGSHIQAVHMLPGYTHNIINLSDTEDLVTVMYCNEIFNPSHPDTFYEPV